MKVKTDDNADIGIAEVDGPDGPRVRVGLITTESGRWDAGFTGEERKTQLREQIAQKQALFDSDNEQPDGLEDEITELGNELEDLESERTAIVTPEAMADLHRQLGEAVGLARANKVKQDATLKALEALDEQRDDLVAEFSDAELERKIRRGQSTVHSKKYRLRLLRQDPDWAHAIPEAEADVAEAERQLEPLLAQRAELMPPDARARLEDLERQAFALNEDDIDDPITSAEVPVPNGGRIVAEIWGSDDVDSDWVTSRLYVLRSGETTEDADNEDGYAYLSGLKGLTKLIAGLEPAVNDVKGPRVAVRPHVRALVAELLRKYDPTQPRQPDGKWGDGPAGMVKKLLTDLAGGEVEIGAAIFADREGLPTGRYVDFSTYDEDEDEYGFEAGSDEEAVGITLNTAQFETINASLALLQLKADPPPLDPSDRNSVLLHSMLATSLDGGINMSDGSYVNFSALSDGGFEVEVGDGADAAQVRMNAEELAQLHASIAARLIEPGKG